MKLTKAQQQSLFKLWKRRVTPRPSYLAFRRTVFCAFGDVAMIQLWGMVIGIESDGHTHS